MRAPYQVKVCLYQTMLNQSTLPYLDKIHKEIVNDMKCSRHEVHPMYPRISQVN